MKEKDAVEEALKMMRIPMRELPPIAIEYVKYLSNKVGACMEVYVTAYAYYNQAMLEMPCEDSLYVIPDEEFQWFLDRGYC